MTMQAITTQIARAATVVLLAALTAHSGTAADRPSALDAPSLASPIDGATDLPTYLFLDWYAVPGAHRYDLELTTPSGTELIAASQEFFRLDSLDANATYSWRVRGKTDAEVGPWSSLRSFSTGTSTIEFGASTKIMLVANAAGLLTPPDMAAFAFNRTGFPWVHGRDRPQDGRNQSTNSSTWGLHVESEGINFGPATDTTSFLSVVSAQGESFERIFPTDFEMRFTPGGGDASIDPAAGTSMSVPFELWSIGSDTPDDPSDDVRMIPVVRDRNENGEFDLSGDHAVSGNVNDPYTDVVTWYYPADVTPGSGGYDNFFAGDTGALGDPVLHKTVLVNWNGGSEAPYDADMPEVGTVLRIDTGEEHTVPHHAAPANDVALDAGQVDFFWTEPDGGVSLFQLATDVDFTDVVLEVDSPGRHYTADITVNGTYHWRVRSALGGWSKVWSIEIRNGVEVSIDDADNAYNAGPIVQLLPNHPEPFADVTKFAIEVREPVNLRVNVYDVLGRRMATLVDERLTAGRKEVNVDARGWPAGIYFYVAESGPVRQTRRMTVVR